MPAEERPAAAAETISLAAGVSDARTISSRWAVRPVPTKTGSARLGGEAPLVPIGDEYMREAITVTVDTEPKYTDSATNLRYYEPDFVAVDSDGVHYVIETKG